MYSLLPLLPLMLGPVPGSAVDPPRTGQELIRQMHDRYAGKWYRTLTFVQKTTLPDGVVETWYEAAEIPGKLRIDIAPPDSMNTIIFRNDSIFQFRGGKLERSKGQVHPLMVLGFDVYVQPVAETLRQLELLDFDLSKLYETRWQGRRTYVVGATAGDTSSAQFWIDQERLYFVRSLEPSKQRPGVMLDTRFEKYQPMAGGWLEMEVQFLAGGESKMLEQYTRPRVDMKLDSIIFSTDRWVPPGWVK